MWFVGLLAVLLFIWLEARLGSIDIGGLFASELEKIGVDYVQLLLISIPRIFFAVMLGTLIANFID